MKYGPIQRPEEQASASVAPSHEHELDAAYGLYTRIARAMLKKHDWNYELSLRNAGAQQLDQLYDETIRLLQGINISPEAVHHAAEKLRGFCAAGPFISAVHNLSSLDTLVLKNAVMSYPGYRLAAGKTLAFGEKATTDSLGWYSKGTILNWGHCSELGSYSEGVCINWGKASYRLFAVAAGTTVTYWRQPDYRIWDGWAPDSPGTHLDFSDFGGVNVKRHFIQYYRLDDKELDDTLFRQVEQWRVKTEDDLPTVLEDIKAFRCAELRQQVARLFRMES